MKMSTARRTTTTTAPEVPASASHDRAHGSKLNPSTFSSSSFDPMTMPATIAISATVRRIFRFPSLCSRLLQDRFDRHQREGRDERLVVLHLGRVGIDPR